MAAECREPYFPGTPFSRTSPIFIFFFLDFCMSIRQFRGGDNHRDEPTSLPTGLKLFTQFRIFWYSFARRHTAVVSPGFSFSAIIKKKLFFISFVNF